MWTHIAYEQVPTLKPCHFSAATFYFRAPCTVRGQLKGAVKEPNMFHNYETEKITRKASDAAEYIELFGSFARDHHARRINVIL